MSEVFWDEKFEWLEQQPVTDDEYRSLLVEERIGRERVLSCFLAAYKGRHVLIKNQTIVTSAETLHELLKRGDKTLQQLTNGSDGYPLQVPVERSTGFFYEQAA